MENDKTPAPPARPWYREPWPWILMAGPAIALIACMLTIYLATTRYVDIPITEGVTRQGLVVTKSR
uniref:lipoprotein n=1 Tax=Bordetella sputigena TaxID=1416810 RepID=UPI0039F01D94